MSDFIEWRGNVFQKSKVLSVTKLGDFIVYVKVDGADPAKFTYDSIDKRNAAMDEWREALIGPKPMPVLVGGEPMEDDKTDYKSLYEKGLNDNFELQLQVDRLEALLDGDEWI